MLKIYSVQHHEKYHLVPLVSCCFVSHLGSCFDSSIFSSLLRPPLSPFLSLSFFSVSCFDPLSPRSIFASPPYIFSFLLSCACMCLGFAQCARTRYSFFSVRMPSGAWYAEQFCVRDYASRAISQLIDGAGKARADTYPIARYTISNYAA